jgi:hypothetical protein
MKESLARKNHRKKEASELKISRRVKKKILCLQKNRCFASRKTDALPSEKQMLCLQKNGCFASRKTDALPPENGCFASRKTKALPPEKRMLCLQKNGYFASRKTKWIFKFLQKSILMFFEFNCLS